MLPPAAYSRPATISSLVRYPLQEEAAAGVVLFCAMGGGGGGSRGVTLGFTATCPAVWLLTLCSTQRVLPDCLPGHG